MFYPGILAFQMGNKRCWERGIIALRFISCIPLDDKEDIVNLFIEFIIMPFILNPQHDQHATGHTDRQTRNIDKRKAFMLGEISKRHFQIIFEHDSPPIKRKFDERKKGSDHVPPVPEPGQPGPSRFGSIEEFFPEILQNTGSILRPCQLPYDPLGQPRGIRIFIF
jgi:hypothetical protein